MLLVQDDKTFITYRDVKFIKENKEALKCPPGLEGESFMSIDPAILEDEEKQNDYVEVESEEVVKWLELWVPKESDYNLISCEQFAQNIALLETGFAAVFTDGAETAIEQFKLEKAKTRYRIDSFKALNVKKAIQEANDALKALHKQPEE